MRISISVTKETNERLKQYAYENHTTVSGAITQWIWRQKIKHENLPGQIKIKK